MWIEQTNNGKYKFSERYTNPITNKQQKASVTLEKNNAQAVKLATKLLQEKIETKIAKLTEKTLVQNTQTFSEIAKKWLAYYQNTVKPRSYTQAKSLLNTILNEFNDIRFEDLNAPLINKHMLNNLTSKKHSYATETRIKGIFVLIIKYALKFENIDKTDIIRYIDLPKINTAQKNDLKYLTKEEFQALIESLEKDGQHDIKRLVIIQTGTGMRFNEVVAIDYKNDIDFDNNAIRIHRNYDPYNRIITTPKNNKERIVFFNDYTKQALIEQIEHANSLSFNPDNMLFMKYNKRVMTLAYIHPFLKKYSSDKKITTHYFRHTFITLAVEAGISKDLIARQVGHADTMMIDKIYAHFTKNMEAQQKEAISKLNFF